MNASTSMPPSNHLSVRKRNKAVRFLVPTLLPLVAVIISVILYWTTTYPPNWYLILAPIIIALLGLALTCKRYSWVGFQKKTLWDWMNLLIVPVVIAGGGIWFNAQQEHISQAIVHVQQQDDILTAYMDKMSELLVKEHLRSSTQDDDVRAAAHLQTLIALRRLDGEHKRILLNTLHEAGLVRKDKTVISLQGALLYESDLRDYNNRAISNSTNISIPDNLSGTNLNGSNLSGADLSGADLSGANFAPYGPYPQKNWPLAPVDILLANFQCPSPGYKGQFIHTSGYCITHLTGTNLSGANLSGADLSGADLSGADLSNANLRNTYGTTPDQLKQARSLHGTIMPDGSKHS